MLLLTMVYLISLHLAVYGAVGALWPPTMSYWWFALAPVLIWISVEDFRSFEIPDTGWILLLCSGLAFRLQLGDPAWQLAPDALVWPIAVWIIVSVHARLRGRQGLGFGDVKLLSGIGVWVGLVEVTSVLLVASLSGILAIGAIAAVRRQQLHEAATNMIAFGPFLCLSCWAVLLQGGRI